MGPWSLPRYAFVLLFISLTVLGSGRASLAQSVEDELEALRDTVQRALERIEELEQQQQDTQSEVEAAREAVEEAQTVRVEPDRGSPTRLEISGRINQAFLFADNGSDDQAFIVDNDNSGSRFGLRGESDVEETTVGAYLELGFEVNTTDEIDFGDDGPVGDEAGESDFLDVRHAEVYIENDTYGTLALGFGDIATESISEVDFSGTGCCFSESDVDDLAGGLAFETGGDVDSFFSNLDGFRTSRVAYTTPTFAGFNLSVAGRQEDETFEPDVSVSYGATIAEHDFEAAVGWRLEDEESNGTDLEDSNTVHGSFSILSPTGLNFTAAAGGEFFDEEDVDLEEEYFVFGKVGWRAGFFDMGETRFSVDGFFGEDITNDFGVDDGNFDDPVEAFSVGGGVVQVVDDFSTEFYVGGRVYWLELPDSAGVGDPDALYAITTGARVRF
ncbi:MAG: porin [Geminicoccaceae bacterium]